MMDYSFDILFALLIVISVLSAILLVMIYRYPEYIKFTNLEGRFAVLKTKEEILAPQVKESAALVAGIEQNRATEDLLRIQIEKLQLQEQQLAPLGIQVAELEARLNQKHNDLNIAVGEERDLREKIIRCQELKKTEEKTLDECKDKLLKVDAKLSEVTSEYKIVEPVLADTKRELSSVKDALSHTQSKSKKLDQEYISSKEKFDLMTEKHSNLKGEATALEKEIESRMKHLEVLKTDIINAGGSVDAAADKMEDLWNPCFSESLNASTKSVSEQERMTHLEQTLKEKSLVFAPRTLHAFHTALKVADISPLTVLSGISGTGKSLLPRVYSEAIGVHFMNLAVQPRWDSPQDMFGFYNYMEQKYKATELARAMVQFEVHNQLKHGGGLKNQMMMVLLDEMNLARVEYYFSEFLSKLEIRRDIDPVNKETRRKAEIALEMGHGGEKQEVRLYPDRNILFVGTMNEDESTQNLSDKVLDRASVLRFGRPATLENTQSVATIRSRTETTMLHRDAWMKWVDISNKSVDAHVMQTIQALNDVMEMVGKPFAHRVAQAISSYCLNYPDWVGENRINKALADQVEQRILPKLRGLNVDDHQEAFKKLSGIISRLEDEELSRAFDKGKGCHNSRGMNSFIWRGVDRSV